MGMQASAKLSASSVLTSSETLRPPPPLLCRLLPSALMGQSLGVARKICVPSTCTRGPPAVTHDAQLVRGCQHDSRSGHGCD